MKMVKYNNQKGEQRLLTLGEITNIMYSKGLIQ